MMNEALIQQLMGPWQKQFQAFKVEIAKIQHRFVPSGADGNASTADSSARTNGVGDGRGIPRPPSVEPTPALNLVSPSFFQSQIYEHFLVEGELTGACERFRQLLSILHRTLPQNLSQLEQGQMVGGLLNAFVVYPVSGMKATEFKDNTQMNEGEKVNNTEDTKENQSNFESEEKATSETETMELDNSDFYCERLERKFQQIHAASAIANWILAEEKTIKTRKWLEQTLEELVRKEKEYVDEGKDLEAKKVKLQRCSLEVKADVFMARRDGKIKRQQVGTGAADRK